MAKLSVGRKEEIKNLMIDFRKEAETGNQDTFERMCKSERFKIGKQWDDDDVYHNNDRGKFALTINECLPVVLNVAGTEEQNPLDYTVRNVKGGMSTVADVLSALAKNVMDKSNGQEEGGRAFETGASTARGYIGIDITFNNDPLNGDIEVKEYDPYMVLPDPTCTKYNYNATVGGAKYLIIDEWIDKTKVDAKYPRHKRAIKDANFEANTSGAASWIGQIYNKCFGSRGATSYTKDSYRITDSNDEDSNTSKQKFNYRQSTYWWKEWKSGVYVQNLKDPLNYVSLTDSKAIKQVREVARLSAIATELSEAGAEDEAAALMAQAGLGGQQEDGSLKIPEIRIIEKDNEGNPLTVPILNKTIMYGDVLVDQIDDPFNGVTMFPLARFSPYFDLGYEYSIVENLIGPQQMVNYSSSTRANILKNLANSGYITAGGTQPDLEWLEEHGGDDGVIIDQSKYGNKVEKIKPTPYPVGFDAEAQRSKENMRQIAQIDLESAPGTRGTESGRALAIREAQSTKTKGVIFRNWRHTNLILANLIVELIRFTDVFSDDEIMAILDDEDLIDDNTMNEAKGIIMRQIEDQGGTIPEEPQQPNPIRMQQTDPEIAADQLDLFQQEVKAYGEFVNSVEEAAIPIAKSITIDLVRQRQQGRYGVKIDTSPMSPTMRMANRLELQEMNVSLIESGQPGIERGDMIDASDIANKDKIKKNVPQAAVA